MILEMQFKADPIAKLVRNAAKAQRVVSTQTMAGYYLDHIEVAVPTFQASDTTLPLAGDPTIQTQTLEIHQKITAMLVQLTDLQATPDYGPVPSDKLQPASVDVVLSARLTIQGSQPQFCITFLRADGLDLFGKQIASQLGDQLQFNQCNTFDLGQLTSLTQAEPKTLHTCGVAASPDGSRMAMRFELLGKGDGLFDDESPTLTSDDWVAFMGGSFTDRMGSLDWAFFVDAQTLTDTMAAQMKANIEGKVDQIDAGPTATWQPDGPTAGQAQEHGEVDARMFDACWGLFGPVDFDFTATLDVTLSVPSPNLLRADATIGWHGNKWKEFWCTASAVAAGPAITMAANLGANGHPWADGIFWFNPGGIVAGLITILWAFNSDFVTGKLVPQLDDTFKKIDDTHFRQETVITPPTDLPVTGLQLTSCSGTSDGLVLRGTLGNVIELNDPELSIKDWSDREFSWNNEDPCNLDVSYLTAKIYFDDSPYYLFMADPIFLPGDDSAGQYASSISKWDQEGITITLNVIKPGFAPGYDCKILLLTTGGARFIQIKKPASLEQFATPEDQQKYELALEAWRATNCDKATSIWGQLGMYNPKWSVDPGPEAVAAGLAEVIHSWSFAIAGLAPGERVSLLAGHETLGLAQATTAGAVSLDVVLAPAARDPEITLARGDARLAYGDYLRQVKATRPDSGGNGGGDVLAMRQLLLARAAHIALPAPISTLATARLGRGRQLVAAAGDIVQRYDLARSSEPRLVDEQTLGGLRGVVVGAGDRLLAFGEFGAIDLGRSGGRASRNVLAMPIIDAVPHGDRLVALDTRGVALYDGGFVLRRRLPLTAGTALASCGRFIAVAAGAHGVEVFERRGDRLDPAGRIAIDARSGIVAAEGFGSPAALLVRDGVGGGRLFELGRRGQLHEQVHYQREPWYFGSPATGTLLARSGLDPRTATLYRVAGQRLYGTCIGQCGDPCDCSPREPVRARSLQPPPPR
jgi:hypothetical protein